MKITEENYVDEAERAIQDLRKSKDKWGNSTFRLTTSQIRNLLAMSSDIYNEVSRQNCDKLDSKIVSRIEYLRVRFVYECGRDTMNNSIKPFVDRADLLNMLKNIGNSKAAFVLFNRYMEALVAFHRYYGGKD